MRDYIKVAISQTPTLYGYGALGVLALEILLKDALGIQQIQHQEGDGALLLGLGNAFLGISSCVSLVSAGFGMRALRAYHYGQRALQSLWDVDEEFWGVYARADACTRRGLDLALDERLLDFE